MNSDKIFYAAWGLVIIMAGICAIFGFYYNIDTLGIIMIWLLSMGLILVIFGSVSIKSSKNVATTQIIAGLLLSCLSAGVLSIVLNLLNVYITVAIIIIVIGLSIVALGFMKK